MQDSNQHSQNTIPSPKSQKKVDLLGHAETGTAAPPNSKYCGINTLCCSDKGVVRAHHEKTNAAKQCIIETQVAISMEVHRSHVLEGGAKSGRMSISIPEIPYPLPNDMETLVFTDDQKK